MILDIYSKMDMINMSAMMIWDIYSKMDMINMSAMMIWDNSKIYMINMSAMMIWDIYSKMDMINMSAMMIWDITCMVDMGNMSFITSHHSHDHIYMIQPRSITLVTSCELW